jgi:hypothetical protein
MSNQLLDDLEAFEHDQQVAREFQLIPYRVATMTLAELLDRIERNDRVRRYVRSRHQQAKTQVERAAWDCLENQLQHVRDSLIAQADQVEKKRKSLRSKGGAAAAMSKPKRRSTTRRVSKKKRN